MAQPGFSQGRYSKKFWVSHIQEEWKNLSLKYKIFWIDNFKDNYIKKNYENLKIIK